MFPVHMTREGHDLVIIAHFSEPVVDALRRLAVDHVFEIAVCGNRLICRQGVVPNRLDGVLPRYQTEGQYLFVGGGPAREVCSRCALAGDCLGFLQSFPQASCVVHGRKSRPGVMDMFADMIYEDHFSVCPLFVAGTSDTATIGVEDLRRLGLDPHPGIRCFADDVDEQDIEYAQALVDARVDLGNVADVAARTDGRWLGYVLGQGWRREPTRLRDMSFDENEVFAREVMSRIRGLKAGKARRDLNEFRRRECKNCVFGCRRPPYSFRDLEKCHVTLDQIVDENRVDGEVRAWMRVFQHTGHSHRFSCPNSHRQSIGSRPARLASGAWGMELVALSPPYPRLETLSLDEYWRQLGFKSADSDWEMSDVDWALTHWALKALDGLGSTARFHLDRVKRNQIFYIKWDAKGVVEVGSDTWATRWGGWGSRGQSIGVNERPRFHTHYHHPYAHDLCGLLGLTPGAGRGRW